MAHLDKQVGARLGRRLLLDYCNIGTHMRMLISVSTMHVSTILGKTKHKKKFTP